MLTASQFRTDKRCGKSGIPDNAKCSKKTAAKSASASSPEGLKEFAFKTATAVQLGRAASAFVGGNKLAAIKRLTSAGKNAAEYAQERGERTGNKKLLAFATGKNVIESVQAFKQGNLAETANTALEAYSFNKQRQGKSLSTIEELNRGFGDTLQATKWLNAVDKNFGLNTNNAIPKTKRAWSDLTAKTFKRKKKPSGWRAPSRSLLDSESVWAEGYEPKKTKARR